MNKSTEGTALKLLNQTVNCYYLHVDLIKLCTFNPWWGECTERKHLRIFLFKIFKSYVKGYVPKSCFPRYDCSYYYLCILLMHDTLFLKSETHLLTINFFFIVYFNSIWHLVYAQRLHLNNSHIETTSSIGKYIVVAIL